MRRPNHASRFEGIAKTKLQASRASDTETLQSQVNKAAKKRLSLSGLEILHGRLLRQAASFDIHQTDTGPANFMDVELIPLCGFGHTKEWKMADDLRTAHHPRW